MKMRVLFIFIAVLAFVANTLSIFQEIEWLQNFSAILFVVGLLSYYAEKLSLEKLNFCGFIGGLFAASITGLFSGIWYFAHVTMGFWLVSFFFAVKEAIQLTEYSKGSRYMQLYFLLVVVAYAYLISLHMIEMEDGMSSTSQFLIYVIYYINLLVLGIASLIYYLNSYSRKSVYFISFTLSLILSEVLRDMGNFYFRDLSVEIIGGIIKFAALQFAFLFFVTKEKKLRLLNLI